MNLEAVIEACLMASDEALSLERLITVFPDEARPSIKDLKEALQRLSCLYEGRGIELIESALGFRFQTRKEYAGYLNRLWETKPPKYTRAFLETLAIVAYKQPVTRGEIEDIRGVAVQSQHLKAMIERGWVKEIGHKEVPGRPALLATTKGFLDYFGLKNLQDLPPLAEVKALLDDVPQKSLSFDELNEDLAARVNDHEEPIEEIVAETESIN